MNLALSTELFLRFCLFSLMAIGGANAVIPEMHRQIVELNGWMSSGEFASLFAIAQAAPGPNVLIVSLIGWKLAGIPGALACTLGMCLPSSLIAYQVGKLWQRFSASPWRRAIERGLAPVTIGLVLGSATILVQMISTQGLHYFIAAGVALAAYLSRFNPLLWLALAALLGLVWPTS